MKDTIVPKAAASAPNLVFHVLIVGMSLATFSAHLPAASLIAQSLSTDPNVIVSANGAFLFAGVLVQLLGGAFSDRFGRRTFLLAALAVFAVSSLVCAMTSDVATFLVFRMVQCISMVNVVLSRAIIRDTLEEDARLSAISFLTLTSATIGLLSPVLGSWIAETCGWRYVFAGFAIWAAATGLWAAATFKETHTKRSPSIAAFFVGYQNLISDRNYWSAVASIGFSLAGYHLFSSGLPILASMAYGWDISHTGILLGTMTGGYACGGYLFDPLRKKLGVKTTMRLGRAVQIAAVTLALLLIGRDVPPVPLIGSLIFLAGLADGLTVPGATAELINRDTGVAGLAVAISGGATFLIGGLATFAVSLQDPLAFQASTLFALMLAVSVASLVCVLRLRTKS